MLLRLGQDICNTADKFFADDWPSARSRLKSLWRVEQAANVRSGSLHRDIKPQHSSW